MENGSEDGVHHHLSALLSSLGRDFLVNNNGDQVIISSLVGKNVGLYFSASWCPPCRRFTPTLADVYEDLASKGDFEVVFITSDRDNESFRNYFSKMPWLAIPFSDSETRKRLKELFDVKGIPCLVFLDSGGRVSTGEGVGIVEEYGAEAYPFTPESINSLIQWHESAKNNQNLTSLLVSSSRNYAISSDGSQIHVSELEGKMVGLFFAIRGHKSSIEFSANLVNIYDALKGKGEKLEIVFIPLHCDEEEDFEEFFASMPWLSLPCKDESSKKLARFFNLQRFPTLVILGPDGKTLNPDVSRLIEEYGIKAYPFSPEILVEFAEIEKAKREAQTLESVLVSGDKNFVIGKDGSKILVSELVGKSILIYFSSHWCPPCRAFLPKLVDAYHQIREKDDSFEVIFVSSDPDQPSFDEFFATMPWLALPFGDERKSFLGRYFKINAIPAAVVIGPNGKTISTEARRLIEAHGSNAYPFTENHLRQIEEELAEKAQGWPEKMKHELHEEHELARVRLDEYVCDACDETGSLWSFCCSECDFSLHPHCALKKVDAEDDDYKAEAAWICDGDVCRKA